MIGTVAAKTAVVGALGSIAGIVKRLVHSQKTDSLVQFTSVLRVEPITMVDDRLKNVDYLTDVLQTLLSMFSGFYLQAVACMTNVGQINVIRMLDSLNPSRDGGLAASSLVDSINGIPNTGLLSMESYQGARLPRPGQPSLEAQPGKDDSKGDRVSLGKSLEVAKEASNLAVGKLLEITIESNGNRATFPIAVRLATAVVESDVLVHILGATSGNNTLSERFHRWRSGDLQFWRDLVFCQDLIDEQKRLLLKDKSGALAEVNRRRGKNMAASAASGMPSVGSASALVVISKETAQELERQELGKFTDLKFRNAIMRDSLAMIIVVVDQDRENVTIYTRDIQLPTKLSVRELKAANKGSGPDVGEILKMYRAGQSSVF